MDNKYFDNVIAEMRPILDENGFSSKEVGIFENDSKSFKVVFDDAAQMYRLSVAEVGEEGLSEYREINAWLFDDTQTAKDASSVGIDFAVSIRKALGIKLNRRTASGNIDLPTASKSGSITVTGFAKKMLDFYPAIKDAYKDHIALYGNFLYLNFFGESLVPCLKTTLEAGNKKQIKKLYPLFEEAYIKGDRDTVNAVVAVLCATAYNNDTLTNAIREMLSDNTHFLTNFNELLVLLPKNKKLFTALVK